MAEPALPDDLRDAPAPVKDAARWLEQNRRKRQLFGFGILSLELATLAVPALDHDLLGWTEMMSLMVFVPGVLASAGAAIYAGTGSLRYAAQHTAAVARFRELQRLGLVSAPAPSQTTGIDRLVERITALGVSTPGLSSAATASRDRARTLTVELEHLEQAMAADPDLRFRLSGVAERIQGEIAEIRARLAETYATLLDLSAVEQDSAALPDAIERLRAELEVSSQDTRSRDAARRSEAQSSASRG